ncbi:serine/threonine protein phosphatase [Nonlabens ulvanivorans]|uniref:Serine/threonine protein phosphatase n=1 Tax=Nonlabens ulvanivorans TaxID=906888 RepID=A0A090QH87_NONUL|nr:metallophosphoesterase family protein [Nonlabens ulvanivorans]GAL01159.1 serine/threonine protein phosphatase [Nonlabens ulvanivorans]
MSTYVVSDIHGCNSKFRRALKAVRLKKTDRLIILGDMIDRGSESKEVLDTIFLLLENNFEVISILGNHEDLLLKSLDDFNTEISWLKNGGIKTLESFSTTEISRIPDKYIDYLASLKSHFILDDFIFVHAGINMLAEQPLNDRDALLWLRDWEKYYDSNWLKSRMVIHGHTPISMDCIMEQFEKSSKVICIDNGSFMDKKGGLVICAY